MSVYGYLRVSSDKQDLTNQKHEVLEYANNEKMGDVTFVEETISSKIKFEKRDISDLISKMKEGDTLLVTELSRIGRSTMEVMSIFKMLVERGVKTHIIKSNFKIGTDEDKITSAVLIFAFSLAAELERELISQRTKSALAKKKAEGMKLGRKKGQKVKSGTITLIQNGVLIQDNVEIKGTTPYIGWPKNPVHGKGPIKLQDHGDNSRVSYRNIWVRELE